MLTYKAEGLITAIATSGGNLSFAYDDEGRRVKKVWTPNGGATITTYFIYNAFGQTAEYSTEAPSSTGTYYLFRDMLGSVRAVSSSGGDVVEFYDYLPFGRMLSRSDNGRSSECFPPDPDS